MNIFVTGALGHIGSYFIRQVANEMNGSSLLMIDDLSTQRYSSLFSLPENVRYQFIEARVQEANLNELLDNIDVVVHFAASTDAAGTADKPELMQNNNFAATRAIAEACLKKEVPLIFPSSTSVYGTQDNLVDENCVELNPQSPYAHSKIDEENFLRALAKQGLKVAICRLGTIYGVSPGMRFHTAVNKFCWQAVMKQPLTVWETALDQKRPYLELDDAVKALFWIMQHRLYQGEVYNILSGNHTVREVIDYIRHEIEYIEITHVKHKIMNQLSYEVSRQKFMNTGFGFNGVLKSGISNTIQLLKNAYHRGVI